MKFTIRLAMALVSLLLLAACTSMTSENIAVSELALPQLSDDQAPRRSIESESINVTGTQAEDFRAALVATLGSYGLLASKEDENLRVTAKIEELKPTSLAGPNPEYSARISYRVTGATDGALLLEDTLVSKYMVPAASSGIRSSVYSQELAKYLVTDSPESGQSIVVSQHRDGETMEYELGVSHEDAAFPVDETKLHSALGDERFFFAREGAYRKNILGFLILLRDLL